MLSATQKNAINLAGPGANREPCDSLVAEFARLNLIGESPAFLDCLRMIKRAAGATAPILLQGATGTGKELAARAIHYLGPRRGTPFIPVNCGAIPETLIESEFFGHEKGSFTGASNARVGLVAQACGGTLFLDEVDTLSAKAQVVLLRFLQDQSYRPVGARAVRQSDTKIIAACNADLGAGVRAGRFREDLLFRLAIITLPLPPLHARSGDIALLAQHFMRLLSGRYGVPKVVDPSALTALEHHDWPGNVRELENVLHRAYVICADQVIREADLALDALSNPQAGQVQPAEPDLASLPFREAKARAIDDFEKRYLRRLIAAADGNVTLAASRAGKERRALGKLLKKHRITRQTPLEPVPPSYR